MYFISNNEINFYHPVFVIQSRNNVIGAVVKIMLKVITSKLGAEVGDCEVTVNSPIGFNVFLATGNYVCE